MRGIKLFFLFCLCFGFAFAKPVISVSSVTNPSSVFAGDSGFVSVTVSNTGEDGIDDVWVNVTNHSPELIIGDPGWSISRIAAGSSHDASFLFKVADSASNGVFFIDFTISFTGYGLRESTGRAFVTVSESTELVYSLSSNELLPGNNNVELTIINPNNRSVSNVLVKLVGFEPFSVLDLEKHIALLEPFDSEVLDFSVWVDDVSEGVYSLTLIRDYLGLERNATLNFRVHGEPDLTYEVVEGYIIEAGSRGNVSFFIRNTGLVNASDVKVSLMAVDPISISNPEQYFEKVVNNDSIIVTYAYSVSNDAEPGIYPVTLGFDYGVNESHDLQFEVIGVPDLEIAGVNTDPERTFANSEFTVSVQVENVGSGKARNVKAFLTVNEDIKGVTDYFIGPIEADDIDSAVFDLIVGDLPEGPSDLLFNITYTDLEGVEYSLNESLRVYIRRQPDYTLITVAIIVILLVVIIYFRKRIFDFIKNLGKMI